MHPYDNWKLSQPYDELVAEKQQDGEDAFEDIFENRVISITELYDYLKKAKNLSKKTYCKAMTAVLDGVDYLHSEMYEVWNQDIPGSCHNNPPTDNFELLDSILEAEQVFRGEVK